MHAESFASLYRSDSLRYEASWFTAWSSICAFQEQQLRLVQHIHEHWQLCINQWHHTILQCVNDILTEQCYSNINTLHVLYTLLLIEITLKQTI